MTSAADSLRDRLTGTPVVGVIGLGYVGLPLAAAFAESGATVMGIDLDMRRIERIMAGESFVEDVPSETLRRLVGAGRLTASDDWKRLRDADAIVICVPTPLGKSREPDISFIVSAADSVARIIRRGQLVVLESTTYPGTTHEVLLPRFEAQGLEAGTDFFLAFSPERIDPGNKQFTLREIPKVVGGVSVRCRDLAALLYGRVSRQVVSVSSPEAAEMVKLYENTFRSVNIALVNEFAIMCRKLGVDIWEIIRAAATKPFGFMPFYPGPGLGGHCLPSDPYYLSWKVRLAGYEPRFITFADEINRHMPEYVVSLVADALNERERSLKGSSILVLGVAYKANVADTRDSPALEIIELLRLKGARVEYHDPHVPAIAVNSGPLQSVDWSRAELRHRDAVLITTAHAGYDWAAIVREAPLVVDTRNATGGLGSTGHVIRL
ncbi:MAG: nucleotide sugar dehydrogenase [Candidatus Rokubacteria bacterium]|nr:nucleotide sugar dehydrogenase [Candidatus Rokubacteria bacterium]